MLILVRHGRTAANAQRRLQGRLDLSLDDVGRAQAARVAGALTGPFRVVSSPLRRAVETAGAFGVAVTIDERWVEMDFGVLDGEPLESVPSSAWLSWRSDPSFSVGGSEPMTALFDRVSAACRELHEEATEHDVVVVSHVGPIKAAVTWALGVPVTAGWRTHLDHASITRVGARGAGAVLLSFNETGHLF